MSDQQPGAEGATGQERDGSIYHIVPEQTWHEVKGDVYHPASLERDEFIHCSAREQVARVANSLFPGRKDLLLLAIDPEGCAAEVRWEDLYDLGEKFPHLYGPLPVNAVTRMNRLRPDADGKFWISDIF